jgi:hypothetical protein
MQIDGFLAFDSPSTLRHTFHGALNNYAESRSTTQTPALHQQNRSRSLPDVPVPSKSALKRKAEALDSGGAGLTNGANSARPVKPRTVSFERMSNREGGSPGETPGRTSATQTRPGPNSPHARRGRPSLPSSTPKPSIETDRLPPPGPTSRPIRGTKHPSGHPPSILPPEKVFPVSFLVSHRRPPQDTYREDVVPSAFACVVHSQDCPS